MIDYQEFHELKRLQKKDWKAEQIAVKLGRCVKTVHKWLKAERYTVRRKNTAREGILSPYKSLINKLLDKHDFSASQIYRRIRDEGYGGSEAHVRRYVSNVRPQRKKAYLSLAFAPGEAAQVDWGYAGTVQVGNVRRRLYFFVMVLGYSRMMYVSFSMRQSMEHFLTCHRDAFEFFEGVPRRVVVDNCKTAVLSNKRGHEPVLNPAFVEFATHYGFEIQACNVRSPHEKGQVEAAVKFVRSSLLRGLELSNFEALQPACREWFERTANVRTHGTTGKRPLDMFVDEKKQLAPLPLLPYECSATHTVRSNSQFRVRFEGNKYSVPAEYASQQGLILLAAPQWLTIFHQGRQIAKHKRSYESKRDFEDPDHPKPILKQKRKAKDQKNLQRFISLGPVAETYLGGLQNRRLDLAHHIRQILADLDAYGEDAVLAVMHDGCRYGAYGSDYITNQLQQKNRSSARQHPLHLSRNQDVLDIKLPKPDLSVYDPHTNKETPS
jgi:transposase